MITPKMMILPSRIARSHPAGTLGRRLLLHISDIMHVGDQVPCISADANLSTALMEMTRKGLGMTAVIGLCGSFTAGLFSWYALHRHGAGLVLSVLFSMLLVWLFRRSRGGGHVRSRRARVPSWRVWRVLVTLVSLQACPQAR